MTATALPSPPFSVPIQDQRGELTRPWYSWFLAVYNRLGGQVDKVDAAHALAAGAVPNTTQVVSVNGLQGGGTLSSNIAVKLYKATDMAASLPTTGIGEGEMAYATNGRKSGEGGGAGTGCQVWWSAGAWYAIWSGLAVTT